MIRAGREPAEDLKRRFVTACQEVGLNVNSAHMYLSHAVEARLVLVEASLPDWPHEMAMLTLMASVPISGEWPECVDIRCSGSEDDPKQVNGPWMRGRTTVPMAQLIEQLRETLQEREKVVAAAKLGIPGPYKFPNSVWERPDLFSGKG